MAARRAAWRQSAVQHGAWICGSNAEKQTQMVWGKTQQARQRIEYARHHGGEMREDKKKRNQKSYP